MNENSRRSPESTRLGPSGKSRRHRSRPPYNPSLQKLIEGKNKWAEPLDPSASARGFKGWHQRGYLPHRDAPGLQQFVTLRLGGSLPRSRRGEWEALLRIENNRRRRAQLEDYLDRGYGNCWLRQPSVATLAEDTLEHGNGRDYELLAWVIMPNHAHVLFEVWTIPMSRIVKAWKTHIGLEANKILIRHGAFWERDCWDTYMRDHNQMLKAQRYIEQNPVKARLVQAASDWPWSSARFRDCNGALRRRR